MKQLDLTIIIPTHNRHDYLRRIVDYYSYHTLDWPIIVCDSSAEEYNSPLGPNIKYMHFPNSNYESKLSAGVNGVTTKYCLLCADDDFIVPSAIEECVSFLNSHSDYASAQGKYVSFVYKSKIELRQLYIPHYKINVCSQFHGERIVQQFNPYMHQVYSVHRNEVLMASFDYAFNNKISSLTLLELLVAMIAAINGKHRILSVFYCARESLPFSAGVTSKSVEMIARSPEYKDEYNRFLEVIISHLRLEGQLGYEDARVCVLNAMDTYLNKFLPEIGRKTKSGEVKTRIKQTIPKFMLPAVLSIHRKILHFTGLDYSRKDFDRYFYEFGSEGKRELDTILQLVEKHNIRPNYGL